MSTARLNAIGDTAMFVAALRAAETQRADRLFEDPYAMSVLAAAGMTGLSTPGDATRFVALMADQVAIRTRFLDDALLGATTAGCLQVVLVASGMDSRAFRLDWPAGVDLFELDQPSVLSFKEEAFTAATPRCARHAIGVDLRADWPKSLLAAGFRTNRATAWLTEGLLYALTPAAADGLLGTIGSLSAPGSTIALDHIQYCQALEQALTAANPTLVDLWLGGPADPADWLRRHGWQPEVTELADLARHHGRPVHPAYDPYASGAHSWLVTGSR